MRALPRQAQGGADVTEVRILEWIEHLFSAGDDEVRETVHRLRGAAQVAPELFRAPAVDALVQGAAAEPFMEPCLQVLAVLACQRPDLDGRLAPAARAALDAGRCLVAACQVLVEVGGRSNCPPDAAVVAQVIRLQNHIRPIGGWPTKHPDCPVVDLAPDYSSSTRLLVQAYDRQPSSVDAPLRAALQKNGNRWRRANACGVIRGLLRQRPRIGTELLADIADSLELDDESYEFSADGAACQLLVDIFLHDPGAVDDLLVTRLPAASEELQVLYIQVYDGVLRDRLDEPGPGGAAGDGTAQEAVARAFRRCLDLLQDESLHLEARLDVAEAIKCACRHHVGLALDAFDTMLGTLANLSLREQPPPPRPRLLLPGEPDPSPALAALEQHHRQMRWDHFRSSVADCLEELARERPAETAQPLLSAFNGLDSKVHEALKADVLLLLGEVGRCPGQLPDVLPAIWKGLMDYDSVRVRGRAIEALTNCFECASINPPSNVLEILLLHLQDTYCFIHLAVLRTLAWHADWLTPQQTERALQSAYAWAVTYRRDEPHRLDEVFRAVLALSCQVPQLRARAVQGLVSLRPTTVPIVDEHLTDLLVDHVDPREPGAESVARQVGAWLASSRRDPFPGSDKRLHLFAWLHRLPPATFRRVAPQLRTQAREVARRDPLDACLFASLFAAFGAFDAEAEVLALARAPLPDGRWNEGMRAALEVLEQGAERNRHRARPTTV
jgi:hypothetical protein